MRSYSYPSLALALLIFTTSSPGASAQDRFGAAVTWAGADEVVVLKPGAAIGPAAALVFRLGQDGSWAQDTRVAKLEGGYREKP